MGNASVSTGGVIGYESTVRATFGLGAVGTGRSGGGGAAAAGGGGGGGGQRAQEQQQQTEECPICFMHYHGVNRTTCCAKPLCTECYLQVGRQEGTGEVGVGQEFLQTTVVLFKSFLSRSTIPSRVPSPPQRPHPTARGHARICLVFPKICLEGGGLTGSSTVVRPASLISSWSGAAPSHTKTAVATATCANCLHAARTFSWFCDALYL